MAKNSFIAYETIYDMLKELPDDLYIKFSKAVFEYGFYGTAPELSGIEKALWTQIQFCIDNSKEYRKAQSERRKTKSNQTQPNVTETNQTEPNTTESNQTQPNVNVNGNVNDNVNTHEKPEYIKQAEESCVRTPSKNIKQLTMDLYDMLQAHNRTAPQDRKIPMRNDVWQFTVKNMRELLDAVGPKEPEDKIRQALCNYIKVAQSDTWQKTFTWRSFCKNYQNFTPEYFTLSKYLNTEPETEDATQRPEYKFYMRMRLEARFHVETFQDHIDDWKKAGRPEGDAYYKLQDEWEVRKCS